MSTLQSQLEETLEGIFLKDVPKGRVLEILTKDGRIYYLTKFGDNEFKLQGDPGVCPVPTKVLFHGSSFKGGAVVNGFIGKGLTLLYTVPARGYFVTTAEVEWVGTLQAPREINGVDM